MIFIPFMKSVRKISLRGRFAIALRGCELLAEKKEIMDRGLSGFFPEAWEYTSTRDFAEWEASVADYFDKDFGDGDLTRILHRSLDIGGVHLYGAIDDHGEMQTVYALWDILDVLHNYDILLEDTEKVRAFSPFTDIGAFIRNGEMGFGRPFGRAEIVPLIEYVRSSPIRDRIDMRPS